MLRKPSLPAMTRVIATVASVFLPKVKETDGLPKVKETDGLVQQNKWM